MLRYRNTLELFKHRFQGDAEPLVAGGPKLYKSYYLYVTRMCLSLS